MIYILKVLFKKVDGIFIKTFSYIICQKSTIKKQNLCIKNAVLNDKTFL